MKLLVAIMAAMFLILIIPLTVAQDLTEDDTEVMGPEELAEGILNEEVKIEALSDNKFIELFEYISEDENVGLFEELKTKISNSELAKAIELESILLEKDIIFQEVNTRAQEDILLFNENYGLMSLWLGTYGIEAEEEAKLKSFDGTKLVTEGEDSVTFIPEEIYGGKITSSGKLIYKDAEISNARVKVSEEEGEAGVSLIEIEGGKLKAGKEYIQAKLKNARLDINGLSYEGEEFYYDGYTNTYLLTSSEKTKIIDDSGNQFADFTGGIIMEPSKGITLMAVTELNEYSEGKEYAYRTGNQFSAILTDSGSKCEAGTDCIIKSEEGISVKVQDGDVELEINDKDMKELSIDEVRGRGSVNIDVNNVKIKAVKGSQPRIAGNLNEIDSINIQTAFTTWEGIKKPVLISEGKVSICPKGCIEVARLTTSAKAVMATARLSYKEASNIHKAIYQDTKMPPMGVSGWLDDYQEAGIIDALIKTSSQYEIPTETLTAYAFQEGLGVFMDSIYHKELASELNGFAFLGLDTFGDKVGELKERGYLREDFNEYKPITMTNEKEELVNSAIFNNVNYALEAFGAFVKAENENAKEDAQEMNIKLDKKQEAYWTYLYYNCGAECGRNWMKRYKGQIPEISEGEVIVIDSRLEYNNRNPKLNAWRAFNTVNYITELGLFDIKTHLASL